MSAHFLHRLTPEQYLEVERAAEYKSEYYRGYLYAMAGGTYAHGLIIANLVRELGNALRGRDCAVTASDVRLLVPPGDYYTYPDLMVVCGERRFAGQQRDTLLNPVVIVEVLSDSTEAQDRGGKFARYRAIESLQEYVLVAQNEARVERFQRQPGGEWLLTEWTGLDSACQFDSLGCCIPLAEIYDKVPLSP
jgi:Uma2 family endonuclease